MVARTNRQQSGASQSGFSMIEMMIVILIFGAVSAIVLQAVVAMEGQNTQQNLTVDQLQQVRQFVNQITQDIHQCGYPTTAMFDSSLVTSGTIPASTIASGGQACGTSGGTVPADGGLVSVATNAIQFEGDIDNSGTVSEVYIALYASNGTTFPCTAAPCQLQRATQSKAQCLAGVAPIYYTEVSNVLNTNIFQAYNYDGVSVTLPANSTTGTLQNIHAINITLTVKAPYKTLTGTYPIVSIQSEARIANR